MKFRNDNQRKAAFWSMRNKFAAKSETGESLRPVFDDLVSDEPLSVRLREPAVVVKGYTGAKIRSVPKSDSSIFGIPLVEMESGELLNPNSDTIILAGEDYKKEGSPFKNVAFVDPSGKLLKKAHYDSMSPEMKKEWVSYVSEFERDSSIPVYSKKNKSYNSPFGYDIEPGNAAWMEVEVDDDKSVRRKELLGDKLKSEFGGKLPDNISSSIDWYGVADPGLSLSDNRKKVHKDFGAFLESKFSEKDDDLWERVMATREKQRVKASPLDIMSISEEFGDNPPLKQQIIKDLKLYPMHDAIAMWIGSSDFMNDKEYGKVKSVANKFIVDVEGGKFDKSSVKRKSKSKHVMDKTEREEAKMEDASKGRDPDALRSEESLKAEIEDEYGDGYYANHARDDE